jgi:hypothetical protein
MGTTLRERLNVPVAALAFGLLRFIDLHPFYIINLKTASNPPAGCITGGNFSRAF